jgi:hypothetical protein
METTGTESSSFADTPKVSSAASGTVSTELGDEARVVRTSLENLLKDGAEVGTPEECWPVTIDSHVDHIDSKWRMRVSHVIDRKVIRGRKSLMAVSMVDRNRRESDKGEQDGSLENAFAGFDLASNVVRKAVEIGRIVAMESPDVFHNKWLGIEDTDTETVLDPLTQLFDAKDDHDLLGKLRALTRSAEHVFCNGPTLNKAKTPCKIFGDLHGQFRDLLLFLHHYGFPSDKSPHFVFNGDWVDRGAHQIEVLVLIYALKVVYPSKVFLNRGNHEDMTITQCQHKGFDKSCTSRFGPEEGMALFRQMTRSFDFLPLGTLVENRIFVVHGGIGDGDWDLTHLEDMERPLNPAQLFQDLVVYNCLWSDPIDEERRDSFGVHKSPRDGHANMIKSFGADVTERFCARNRLGMIIRSHESECGGNGYEVMHGGACTRVFSARDYEEMANDGAILCIEKAVEDKCYYVRPQVLQSVVKKHDRDPRLFGKGHISKGRGKGKDKGKPTKETAKTM